MSLHIFCSKAAFASNVLKGGVVGQYHTVSSLAQSKFPKSLKVTGIITRGRSGLLVVANRQIGSYSTKEAFGYSKWVTKKCSEMIKNGTTKIAKSGIYSSISRSVTTAGSTSLSSPVIPQVAERYVGRWLAGCAGMCFGAVILGTKQIKTLERKWLTID